MDELSKRLKIAEERLARARRMEELGYLAGGIAHDFNNLLTGILGYASLLRTFLPEGGKGFEAAGAIEQSARRAAELTRRMLEYSQRESPPIQPVGIHRLIEEAAGILSATLPGNVEIRTDLRAPADTVMGDPEILERALLHLGANAGDAMPGGGRLTLATGPFASDGTTAFDNVPVPAGDYISLRVSDTGCGIPESIRNRVFAPFFTTKPEGRGTGLGLALVSRCARKHGGFLRLESREGEGTTFEILLPIRPSTA
ncbi:MAG: periplasmic sensor hybrid histidine kinase [Deltaproteobacteria bacterium]|nr:periplasmic sensor hybrid histidine kinase [Deltaproteobacteria bacterium]